MPEGYEEWAYKNLKKLVKIPIYKKRIEEHLSQLDLSISNREKELNQTYFAEELAKMRKRKELIESVFITSKEIRIVANWGKRLGIKQMKPVNIPKVE